ncbi:MULTISPECIES: LacI family DNA-binding transcriptional regulator [Microbacterium]|uniref:LacI family DNA-binding transcriptional regulator n=1 Tax=Microbacterium TaxID=33882 RepID=UPI001E297467|nr:LacI family DNA-binding transcriptional regulator [Microbacterium nymphoidis]MCD2497691.1 LacI family DNA-binding transcriptional regulator [Microbacterium nymphoidis]
MARELPGPNLASIAEAAGVSVPTVSKVVNGRGGVSDETRERIQSLITEAGYRSPRTRRLRTGNRTMVDLVIGEVRNGYSVGVLNGILEHAREVDTDVVISSVNPGSMHLTDADEWADRMVDSGRQGLIAVTSDLSSAQHAAFASRGLPVVVIDPLNTPAADLPSVGSTNWAGGRAATEHLLSLGHRRIAYLGGPASAECNQARMHGYLAALMAAGIPMRADYLYDAPGFTPAGGLANARTVLDLEDPPTAIFAASDTIALGVLDEARRRGLEVPRDLSIVGFDGTPLAEQTLPHLTSVAQPLHDIGRTALRTLLQLIAGGSADVPRMELATELVVRDSTAPPRA